MKNYFLLLTLLILSFGCNKEPRIDVLKNDGENNISTILSVLSSDCIYEENLNDAFCGESRSYVEVESGPVLLPFQDNLPTNYSKTQELPLVEQDITKNNLLSDRIKSIQIETGREDVYALPFWNEAHDGVNFYVSTPEEDFIIINEYKESMRNWAVPMRPNSWSEKLTHVATQLSSGTDIGNLSLQDGIVQRGDKLVLNSSFVPTETGGGPQAQVRMCKYSLHKTVDNYMESLGLDGLDNESLVTNLEWTFEALLLARSDDNGCITCGDHSGIIDDFITLVDLESAPGYEEVVEVTKQNYIGVMLGLDQDETDNYLANSDLDNIWDLMSGDVCEDGPEVSNEIYNDFIDRYGDDLGDLEKELLKNNVWLTAILGKFMDCEEFDKNDPVGPLGQLIKAMGLDTDEERKIFDIYWAGTTVGGESLYGLEKNGEGVFVYHMSDDEFNTMISGGFTLEGTTYSPNDGNVWKKAIGRLGVDDCVFDDNGDIIGFCNTYDFEWRTGLPSTYVREIYDKDGIFHGETVIDNTFINTCIGYTERKFINEWITRGVNLASSFQTFINLSENGNDGAQTTIPTSFEICYP